MIFEPTLYMSDHIRNRKLDLCLLLPCGAPPGGSLNARELTCLDPRDKNNLTEGPGWEVADAPSGTANYKSRMPKKADVKSEICHLRSLRSKAANGWRGPEKSFFEGIAMKVFLALNDENALPKRPVWRSQTQERAIFVRYRPAITDAGPRGTGLSAVTGRHASEEPNRRRILFSGELP